MVDVSGGAGRAGHGDPMIRAAWSKVDSARLSTRVALVEALNELGAALCDRREYEEALSVTAEVVDLCRAAGDGTSRRELTIALNSRADALMAVGRDDEAWQAATDVVEHMRARRDAEVSDPLSRALGRLVELGARRGMPDAALAAADEQLRLARGLYAADPAGRVEDLAVALNNRQAMLAMLRRPADIAHTARELADLVRQDPRHELLLSRALNNLGGAYVELGRPEQALEPLRDAADLDRKRADEEPARRDSLIRTLTNLQLALEDLDRGDELPPLLAEIVDVRRGLAEAEPAAHRVALGYELNNLAMHLTATGRHQEAMDATAEGVESMRADGHDGAGLALLLWSFAEVRLAAGRELPAALAASEESLAMYEAQADQDNAAALARMRAEIREHLERTAT